MIIIGAGTLATSNKISTGITSISYSASPGVENLWQLGSNDAYDTQITVTKTINITNHAGASTSIPLSPSTTCVDSDTTMDVNIVPAACGVVIPAISETMFITSYSYSKEVTGYGQETWALTSKPEINGSVLTATMVEGIATGTRLDPAGADVVSDQGVELTGSVAGELYDALEQSLSVSAGPGSTGTYDVVQHGKITRIGAGVGREDGKRGNASASIPMNPIYV